MLKCGQGCCRVCPGVLQNVCRVTECVQDAVLTSSLAHQDLARKYFIGKKNILCEFVLKTKILWKIDYFEDSIEALHYETINDDYACPDFI